MWISPSTYADQLEIFQTILMTKKVEGFPSRRDTAKYIFLPTPWGTPSIRPTDSRPGKLLGNWITAKTIQTRAMRWESEWWILWSKINPKLVRREQQTSKPTESKQVQSAPAWTCASYFHPAPQILNSHNHRDLSTRAKPALHPADKKRQQALMNNSLQPRPENSTRQSDAGTGAPRRRRRYKDKDTKRCHGAQHQPTAPTLKERTAKVVAPTAQTVLLPHSTGPYHLPHKAPRYL